MHYDPAGDLMVLQVNTSENTFTQVTQTQFNIDMLDQLKAVAKEQYAFMARVNHQLFKTLIPQSILTACPKITRMLCLVETDKNGQHQ